MEQYTKAERNAKVALHAKMKDLGFRQVSDSEWASGVRRIVQLAGGEFVPWTTYWNPRVWFETPEAAVVWADIEGWGMQEPSVSAEFKQRHKG